MEPLAILNPNFVGMDVIVTILAQYRNQMHDSGFNNKDIYLKKIAKNRHFLGGIQNDKQMTHMGETVSQFFKRATEQDKLVQVK